MAYQVTTGRFVGRTQELARLRELLARAADGEPLVALIGGEAGVGKTRLVEQLAATAQRAGRAGAARRLCAAGRGGPAVRAGHRGAARPGRRPGPGRAGGGRRPGPRGARPAAARPRLERPRARPRVPGSRAPVRGGCSSVLLGVVQRLAAQAPLLWVMEDLHWADRSTRDLLAYLATYLRSGRVCWCCTFRSDELHRLHPLRRLLGELARNRRVQRLELPRFTRAELAEQLAGLLGADPPARLVDDIYARSEGNPFFAEELLLAGAGADPGGCRPACRRCC